MDWTKKKLLNRTKYPKKAYGSSETSSSFVLGMNSLVYYNYSVMLDVQTHQTDIPLFLTIITPGVSIYIIKNYNNFIANWLVLSSDTRFYYENYQIARLLSIIIRAVS